LKFIIKIPVYDEPLMKMVYLLTQCTHHPKAQQMSYKLIW